MSSIRLAGCTLLLGVVCGCAQTDPYTRAGMWQPDGVNDRNLAAMVARPADLLRGHGEVTPQPVLAAAAVNRLLSGVPTPLPSLSGDAAPGAGGTIAPAGPAPTPSAGPAATPVAGGTN